MKREQIIQIMKTDAQMALENGSYDEAANICNRLDSGELYTQDELPSPSDAQPSDKSMVNEINKRLLMGKAYLLEAGKVLFKLEDQNFKHEFPSATAAVEGLNSRGDVFPLLVPTSTPFRLAFGKPIKDWVEKFNAGALEA